MIIVIMRKYDSHQWWLRPLNYDDDDGFSFSELMNEKKKVRNWSLIVVANE